MAAGALAIAGCVAATTSDATETPRTSPAPRPIPVTPTVPEPPPPIAVDAVVVAGDVGSAVDATRALFVQNCAPCHGVNGDGQGTTKLERPARSFLAGGFSYGNTPEAITRSITHGIPGTPMPSFGATMKDDQRAALAAYVIALGPPQIEVGSKETVLVVRDEPVFARGKLPPLVDGGPEIVRGLLVGTPDGLTFEYDLDDVRLVAVRTGEFADRRDWLGRGGDALQPLGTLIEAPDAGQTRPWSLDSPATRVRAELRSTSVRSGAAHLSYELVDDKRLSVMAVEETPRVLAGPGPSGYVRSWTLRGVTSSPATVAVELGGDAIAHKLNASGQALFYDLVTRPSGGVDVVGVRVDLERSGLALRLSAELERPVVEMALTRALGQGETSSFQTFRIPGTATWPGADEKSLRRELAEYTWP